MVDTIPPSAPSSPILDLLGIESPEEPYDAVPMPEPGQFKDHVFTRRGRQDARDTIVPEAPPTEPANDVPDTDSLEELEDWRKSFAKAWAIEEVLSGNDPEPLEEQQPPTPSDVLRIGSVLLKAERTANKSVRWHRQVSGAGWYGSVYVREILKFHVLITWIDTLHPTQIQVSADDEDLETAFGRCRERGQFPDEFFAALSEPLEGDK